MLEIELIDVCLPSYFNGSSSAYFSITVRKNMPMSEIRSLMIQEVRQGLVLGSDSLAHLLGGCLSSEVEEQEAERAEKRTLAAINRFCKGKGRKRHFRDLEDGDEDCESVYAYFRIVEA